MRNFFVETFFDERSVSPRPFPLLDEWPTPAAAQLDAAITTKFLRKLAKIHAENPDGYFDMNDFWRIYRDTKPTGALSGGGLTDIIRRQRVAAIARFGFYDLHGGKKVESEAYFQIGGKKFLQHKSSFPASNAQITPMGLRFVEILDAFEAACRSAGENPAPEMRDVINFPLESFCESGRSVCSQEVERIFQEAGKIAPAAVFAEMKRRNFFFDEDEVWQSLAELREAKSVKFADFLTFPLTKAAKGVLAQEYGVCDPKSLAGRLKALMKTGGGEGAVKISASDFFGERRREIEVLWQSGMLPFFPDEEAEFCGQKSRFDADFGETSEAELQKMSLLQLSVLASFTAWRKSGGADGSEFVAKFLAAWMSGEFFCEKADVWEIVAAMPFWKRG